MGRVYRAKDAQSGHTVALKVLLARDEASRDRFEREARILGTLSHPAIVGYVAHGQDEDGHAYLAMEWADGQPLSVRLRAGPLEVKSAAKLARSVADALACAHEAGVLHRDVKPSNLIVQENDAARVRVVDFGVARRAHEALTVTRTGMIVGSCAYMSPEQARGIKDVDERSDLFSLGCVLYECLTGVRAFGARDATAALAKVLLDEPKPVREIVPAVPQPLADLVQALLRKDRSERPRAAREVAERLGKILDGTARPEPAPEPAFIGLRERRVVWVVLASGVFPESSSEVLVDPDVTRDDAHTTEVRNIVTAFGGALAFLADGVAIATFAGGVPTDEAPRAARCALSLHEALPRSPIAIALGQGVVGGHAPIGDVIDSAADALHRTAPGSIRIDGVDPEWLPAFELRGDANGVLLLGRKDDAFVPRTLLGKPTPCVGRDRELSLLEGLFEDCASEPQARVALLTAPAGAGKSRIRYELLRRLSRREKAPLVLIARCDVMSAGAPFSVVGDALRRYAHIVPGDDDAARERKIAACVTKAAPPFDVTSLAAFLGELCGVSFPDGASDMLRSARRDARTMGDLQRAAFEQWIAGLTDRQPVLLVIEDLHWGDVSSVRVLDSALRNLTARPLFVLALARPEVLSTFPELFSERGLVSLALAPISRRAAESLVREAMGDRLAPADTESLVARAQGNALFLEELIRAAASASRTTKLPDSILGVFQARFDALEPEARRVLRAASVFGDRFSEAGVQALVAGIATGAEVASQEVAAQLDVLAAAELVTPGVSSSDEYRFRHALVRDAAYATLTDEDRTLGHRLAGEALEADTHRITSGQDALALAEHFVRGALPERAVAHLRKAASKALVGNDLRGAIALAERAIALSPSGKDAGVLHAICAEAFRWLADYEHAAEHGLQAKTLLEEGGVAWFLALGEFIAACAYRHDYESALPMIETARRSPARTPEARNARVVCLARGGTQFVEGAQYHEADGLIETLRAEPWDEFDDHTRGWVHWLMAMRALAAGDLATFTRETEACVGLFEKTGEVRNTCSQRTNLAYAYAELGAFERAEPMLLRVHEDASSLGLPMVQAYAQQNLGNVLRAQGKLDEAIEMERRAVAIGASIGDARIEGAARSYLALALLERGDAPAEVEAEANRAKDLLVKNPPLMAFARAVRARCWLAQGRGEEAIAEANAAVELLGEGGEDGETFIRLTPAEIFHALGRDEAASAAAASARTRLLERASRLKDDELRASFLTRVRENARTEQLAEELRQAQLG